MNTTENCTAEHLCKVLASKVNPVGTHAKGLTAVWTTNLNTGEERLLGVSYKTKPTDRGLMLNTCPWCGGSPGHFKRS